MNGRTFRIGVEGLDVNGLFASLGFTGFGPSRFDPSPEPAVVWQVRGERTSMLRKGVRLNCPRRPGVYGMVNARSELIYVGKAKSLRARLLGYFRPNSRDPKAGRIVAQSHVILWEPLPSEFAALLRELELIRRWRPRYNVQGQPARWRRSYVCVGRRPAPYVFLASKPPATAQGCYGPVPGGRQAREAVRRVNDWFGLRDCPQKQEMIFAEQGELFPMIRAAGCIRHEIGTCVGPCTGRCTRATYQDAVRAAEAFLAGTDLSAVQRIEEEMQAASREQAYERAATLRDRLESLCWIREQMDHLRRSSEQPPFVYPVGGFWYVVVQGRVTTVLPAPRDEAGRRAALAEAALLDRKRSAPGRCLAIDEVDGVLLVATWFNRHPEERARIIPLS